jgi:hypothetical protein
MHGTAASVFVTLALTPGSVFVNMVYMTDNNIYCFTLIYY